MGTTKAVIGIGQGCQRRSDAIEVRLEAVLSRYQAPFYRKAYQCLGNAADAGEDGAECILPAYKHLDQY
jgi:hypothetical protein